MVLNRWTVVPGNPEILFSANPYLFGYAGLRNRPWDVADDGRFLMIRRAGVAGAGAERTEINVVQNWTEELKRLVPLD